MLLFRKSRLFQMKPCFLSILLLLNVFFCASANAEFHSIEEYIDCSETLTAFDEDVVNDFDSAYNVKDGVLFKNDTLIRYPAQRKADVYRVPEGITAIDVNAFSYVEPGTIGTIHLPASCVDLGRPIGEEWWLEYLGGVINISVDSQNPCFSSAEGLLLTKDGKTLLFYPRGRDNEVFQIPEGIQSIGNGACMACSFKQVIFPESLVSIGENSFCENQLLQVSFNDSLSYIGVGAFESSAALRSVTIPKGVKKIDYNAFAQCSVLHDVQIDEGVRELADYAFWGSPIENITLPASLIQIGDNLVCTPEDDPSIPACICHVPKNSYALEWAEGNSLPYRIIDPSSPLPLYPVCNDGLWGYADEHGELILPYQWSYCGDFRGNGYALVCTESSEYGIISPSGCYVIYPIPFADSAEELGYYGGKDTGVYWLDNGQNMGFFDVQSGYFSGYRFDLTQDPWFDAECSRLLRITYDGETYGYVDRQTGVSRIPCIFEQINTTGFHNGFAFEVLASSKEMVIVRENGTFLSIPDNLSVEGSSFEDHLLLVQDKETKLYGYCDSEGNCAIPPQFEDADSFCNGYAPVSQDGKWSHIDSNGNVCSPAVFDSPYSFESKRAIAMRDGCPVLIDTSGTPLKALDSELTYFGFLPEGVALFGSRFCTGLIDTEGNELLPLSERMYINPYPVDARFFSEGKHPVMNDEGKWGYVNLAGQIAIECKWDQAFPFSNGLARVKLNDQMALIDPSGTVVWKESPSAKAR